MTGGPVTDQRSVSPALPIVFTIVWLLSMVAGAFFGLFSFFLFDAGMDAVSAWTWMIFLGIWGTMALCPISIILGWITWGVTRKRMVLGWGQVLRAVAYALPVLGIASVIIGFAATSILCNDSLTCS